MTCWGQPLLTTLMIYSHCFVPHFSQMSEHPNRLVHPLPLWTCWAVRSSFLHHDDIAFLHIPLDLSSQSLSTQLHTHRHRLIHNTYVSLPLSFSLYMNTYQPPEIPVGWPQSDVWSLVLIKGPDSLLEPVLMERGEAWLHTQDQMLRLPSAVMSWLGPHHQCLPFLNHRPKQWYNRDLRKKEGQMN